MENAFHLRKRSADGTHIVHSREQTDPEHTGQRYDDNEQEPIEEIPIRSRPPPRSSQSRSPARSSQSRSLSPLKSVIKHVAPRTVSHDSRVSREDLSHDKIQPETQERHKTEYAADDYGTPEMTVYSVAPKIIIPETPKDDVLGNGSVVKDDTSGTGHVMKDGPIMKDIAVDSGGPPVPEFVSDTKTFAPLASPDDGSVQHYISPIITDPSKRTFEYKILTTPKLKKHKLQSPLSIETLAATPDMGDTEFAPKPSAPPMHAVPSTSLSTSTSVSPRSTSQKVEVSKISELIETKLNKSGGRLILFRKISEFIKRLYDAGDIEEIQRVTNLQSLFLNDYIEMLGLRINSDAALPTDSKTIRLLPQIVGLIQNIQSMRPRDTRSYFTFSLIRSAISPTPTEDPLSDIRHKVYEMLLSNYDEVVEVLNVLF